MKRRKSLYILIFFIFTAIAVIHPVRNIIEFDKTVIETPVQVTAPKVTVTPAPIPEIPVTPEPPKPTPEPLPPLHAFNPGSTPSTHPYNMLESEDIMAGGAPVDEYVFTPPFDFGFDEDYTDIDGIITFRGNNFRNSGAFGTAVIREEKFAGNIWERSTGSLQNATGSVWTGHGWTGQPLIIKWPDETRAVMDMHEWAKQQEELIEVIYAAMDGHVYFQELETGKDTRDRLYLGFPFKGSGALDPRGYPLLYVGAGDSSARGHARIFIVSLIDGTVLHTFGNNDSFAPRSWWAADSSPLVDAENDRLIYPSENGIIYIITLNTDYNPQEGTISIEPETVKWRYKGKRTMSNSQFWAGIETSIAMFRGYAYFADNGGHMICIDLNTLSAVWVQDILDDSNSTPVFSVEDDKAYIYVSTSYHQGWRSPAGTKAVIPIWKLDAETGEIIWQADDYICSTEGGISGGVQGTIAVGAYELDDMIFVPVARTPDHNSGILAALQKSTGEIVWEYQTSAYSWSSPVCVYTDEGKGYIIYTDRDGYMHLIEGQTGVRLDRIKLGSLIEASPAVYGNIIVIGTRNQKICGVTLT